MNKKYEIINLDNGIRALVVPLRGLKSVTVEVFVKIGSKYEGPGEHGMSHFLEHMAFKGTMKRPSARSIVNEIDSRGAAHNAGTGHEYTSYYIKTVQENVPWALELLADILFNSKFDGEEIKKEKGVIVEEIRMYKDNPVMGLSSEFVKFLYGKSKIGCWNISGEEKDISVINRGTLIDYRERYMMPDDILVVIAGDVDTDFKETTKYFSSFTSASGVGLPSIQIVLNDNMSIRKTQETNQGHFCVGVPTISWRDDRRYAMKLLEIILGGYSSSKLQQRIREDEGMAYYIHSISDSFEEAGYLAFQAGVRPEVLDRAIALTIEEMTAVGDRVDESDLVRAKDYLTGRIRLLMDQSDFWSGYLGQKMLLEGKIMSPEEELAKYRSVKIEDVYKLADQYLTKDQVRLITVSGNKSRV
ncbi:MAG: pitrilysin family protein [Candidatus Shapirobacteria bacterium]|jgi:predicted Zn-dependent peptidase